MGKLDPHALRGRPSLRSEEVKQRLTQVPRHVPGPGLLFMKEYEETATEDVSDGFSGLGWPWAGLNWVGLVGFASDLVCCAVWFGPVAFCVGRSHLCD